MDIPSHLIAYIEATGENTLHEAKGSMSWDDNLEAAKLAKCVASFANSEGGGVIVVGKTQLKDRSFVLEGLSTAEANSFDTTRVANWINSRFDPPVKLTCSTVHYQDKLLVAIEVKEFHDVPTICVKQFDNPDGGRPILRKGAIYVRDENAQSTEISHPSSVRALIGLSRRKGTEELLTTLKSVFTGYSVTPTLSNADLFKAEYERVSEDVERNVDKKANNLLGAWRFSFRPERFEARWENVAQQREAIERNSIRDGFMMYPGTESMQVHDWGVKGSAYAVHWGLTYEGLFYLATYLHEDQQSYEISRGNGTRLKIPATKWLEYVATMNRVICFFRFAGRFASEYAPDEQLAVRLLAGDLQGRKMVSENPRYYFNAEFAEPCQATEFTFEKSIAAGRLLAEWEDMCIACLYKFFGYFPSLDISKKAIQSWVKD